MTGRAKPGQGRDTLQGLARTMAGDLGHELGNFSAAGKRSAQPVYFKGRLVDPPRPEIFQARCRRCGAMAIADQAAWERDGRGYGGSATKDACQGAQAVAS